MSRHSPLYLYLRVAAVAERLRELVDDVRRGGGERGREVLAAADQEVAGERRRRGAAPLEVAGVHVHLVGEAGIEVADLRAADHQRVARRGLVAGDHQRVRSLLLRDTGCAPRAPRRRERASGSNEPGSRTTLPLVLSRDLAVGELAVDRGRRLRVLELAQVVEDAHALFVAEPLLQARPGTASGAPRRRRPAEELALERVQGEDVVSRAVRAGRCRGSRGRR